MVRVLKILLMGLLAIVAIATGAVAVLAVAAAAVIYLLVRWIRARWRGAPPPPAQTARTQPGGAGGDVIDVAATEVHDPTK